MHSAGPLHEVVEVNCNDALFLTIGVEFFSFLLLEGWSGEGMTLRGSVYVRLQVIDKKPTCFLAILRCVFVTLIVGVL